MGCSASSEIPPILYVTMKAEKPAGEIYVAKIGAGMVKIKVPRGVEVGEEITLKPGYCRSEARLIENGATYGSVIGRVIDGSHCVINGSFNIINGQHCMINGSFNWIKGDHNQVEGLNNYVEGDNCSVTGARNSVQGDENEVYGDDNIIEGDDNEIKGARNSFTGNDNDATETPRGTTVKARTSAYEEVQPEDDDDEWANDDDDDAPKPARSMGTANTEAVERAKRAARGKGEGFV